MTRTCIQTTLDIRFKDESSGTYDELEKVLLAHFGTNIESASAVELPCPFDDREVLLTYNMSSGACFSLLKPVNPVRENRQESFTLTVLLVGGEGERGVKRQLPEFQKIINRKNKRDDQLSIKSSSRFMLLPIDGEERAVENHPCLLQCKRPSLKDDFHIEMIVIIVAIFVGFILIVSPFSKSLDWMPSVGWLFIGVAITKAIDAIMQAMVYRVDADIDGMADTVDALARDSRTSRMAEEYGSANKPIEQLKKPNIRRAEVIFESIGGAADDVDMQIGMLGDDKER